MAVVVVVVVVVIVVIKSKLESEIKLGECVSRLHPGSKGVTDDLLAFESPRVFDISYLTIDDAYASDNCSESDLSFSRCVVETPK